MYKYDYAFKKKIVEIHKQTGKGCCIFLRFLINFEFLPCRKSLLTAIIP